MPDGGGGDTPLDYYSIVGWERLGDGPAGQKQRTALGYPHLELRWILKSDHSFSPYLQGTRAWFADDDEGWVSGVLRQRSVAGGKVKLVFGLDGKDKERVYEASLGDLEKTKYADLPPLRNPPMLEGIDDLTLLSHLHEPAGEPWTA